MRLCCLMQTTIYADFVPEKIKTGDALAKRKQVQDGTS